MKSKKQFKYISQFTMLARCVYDSDKNKYLAEASVNDLKGILPPDVDYDLLPIAANACVVNLVNKNNDAITTLTAKAIKDKFAHKPINIEHDRSNVVGHIVNAAFSKFDTNYAVGVGSEVVADDSIEGSSPFNIAIGGYVYNIVAPSASQQIIDSNDPNSPQYLNISLSWELGFDNYKVLVGSQLVEEGEVIDDEAAVETYSKYLKCYGGSGKTDDGRPVYRLLDSEDVVPLGVALTFAPAGQVKGIVTSDSNLPKPTEEEGEASIQKNIEGSENNISQNQTSTVTVNIQKENMKHFTSFAEIKSLTDETVKEYSFANIAQILEEEARRIAKEYEVKVEAEKTASAEAKAASDKALAELATTKEDLAKLGSQIESLIQKEAAAEAFNKFNERMAGIEAEYELDDESRAALAADIRNLDDASFDKFLASFKSYNKKNKKGAAPTKKDDGDDDAAKNKDGSKGDDDAAATQQAALASVPVEPVAGQTLPNTVQPVVSFLDKYRAAFAKDNVTITK